MKYHGWVANTWSAFWIILSSCIVGNPTLVIVSVGKLCCFARGRILPILSNVFLENLLVFDPTIICKKKQLYRSLLRTMGRKTISTKNQNITCAWVYGKSKILLRIGPYTRNIYCSVMCILNCGKRTVHIIYYQIVKGESHYRPSIYTQMGLKLKFMMDKLKGLSMVKHLAPLSAQN